MVIDTSETIEQQEDLTDDWIIVSGSTRHDFGVALNFKEGIMKPLDFGYDPIKEGNSYKIYYEKITELTTTQSQFFKYCKRFYLIDILTSKDDIKIATNRLLHLFDDIVKYVQEFQEKKEKENQERQSAKFEIDHEAREIAQILYEKSMIILFARKVFDKKIVNEGKTGFLTWCALINGDWVTIKGDSCTGKSHIANNTINCLPDDWYFKVSYSDPAALKATLRNKFETNQSYKFFYLQEKDALGEHEQLPTRNLSKDDDGINMLISVKADEGSRFYSDVVEVDIPPMAILSTTTKIKFDVQDSSRTWELTPDDSHKQIQAIVNYKMFYKQHANLKPNFTFENNILQNVARIIDEQNYNVLTPLMDKTIINIPTIKNTITREVDLFFGLLDVITKLNASNRTIIKNKNQKWVISTLEDLQIAIALSQDAFNVSGLDPTSKRALECLEKLMVLTLNDSTLDEKQDSPTAWISSTNITKFYNDTIGTISQAWVNKRLWNLYNLGYVRSDKKDKGNLNIWTTISLTSPVLELTELFQEKITNCLTDWFNFQPLEVQEQLESLDHFIDKIILINEFRCFDEIKEAIRRSVFGKETDKNVLLSKLDSVSMTFDSFVTSDISSETIESNQKSEEFRQKKPTKIPFSEKKGLEGFFSDVETPKVEKEILPKQKAESKYELLEKLFQQLEENNKIVFEEEFLQLASQNNITREYAKEILEKWAKEGIIFQPGKKGKFSNGFKKV